MDNYLFTGLVILGVIALVVGVLVFILRWVLGTGRIIDQQSEIIKRLDVLIDIMGAGDDDGGDDAVVAELKKLNAKIKVARVKPALQDMMETLDKNRPL